MRNSRTAHIILAVIIAIGVAGGAAAIYGTANGPWGYSDSAAYINLARNVLSGAGLGSYSPVFGFQYLTHYPPLYPLLLAGVGWLGADLVDVTRWVSVLSFVGTLFGIGWIFYRHGSSPALAVAAGLLFGLFPTAVMMFTSSMSEPLFVLLFVWSGYFLLEYLSRRNDRWLVASALVTGLLPMTRYIGIAFLISAVVAILILLPGRRLERLGKAAQFGALAGLPFLAWSAWGYLGTNHSVAGRGVQLDWADLAAQFRNFRTLFMDTVWSWVPLGRFTGSLPYWLRYLMLGAGAAALLGLVLWARRQILRSRPGKGGGELRIFGVFGLSGLSYVLVLALTYLFTSPTPDVNNRILLPLYAAVLLALLAGVAYWHAALPARGGLWRQGLLAGIVLLAIAWYTPKAAGTLQGFHAGVGTTAFSWRTSETMQAVSHLPPGIPIVSNNAAAILAWTNRPGYEMLENLQAGFVDATSPYGSSTTDVAQQAFRQQGAALVIFGDLPGQLELAFGEAGRKRADTILKGLVVFGEYQDGSIYFYPK